MEGGTGATGGGDGDTSGGIKEDWKVQFGSDIGLIVVLWWLSTPARRLVVQIILSCGGVRLYRKKYLISQFFR